ncbi:unnamed protein product [Lepeophtheirus salmonis]|uniref:(salmon louse) hypothetical protein n=1 Tax=Lepeophtheirus salmonis TaxID=72036 RepID=A0A7R8H585_LEPSM|nr:unnamed protein product [Lepeophtheirus salmonis]CAF2872136.1 unnamed protein product [Lepeophtheirus salmonis]
MSRHTPLRKLDETELVDGFNNPQSLFASAVAVQMENEEITDAIILQECNFGHNVFKEKATVISAKNVQYFRAISVLSLGMVGSRTKEVCPPLVTIMSGFISTPSTSKIGSEITLAPCLLNLSEVLEYLDEPDEYDIEHGRDSNIFIQPPITTNNSNSHIDSGDEDDPNINNLGSNQLLAHASLLVKDYKGAIYDDLGVDVNEWLKRDI